MKTMRPRTVPVAPGHRDTPATPQSRRVLLFNLARQTYALPLQELQEIVPMAQLVRPPGMPSFVAGFLHLRGEAIPVVRLDRLFGVSDTTLGLYTPLLVLRHSDNRMALVVDKVERIVNVAANGILPVPADHSFNDCADGMFTYEGGIILLLSAERILQEKEHQWLAEFQDHTQQLLREWEGANP